MNLLRHFHEHRARSSASSASLSDFSPKKLLRSDFVHNVIALYGVQACTYALPLLTFPYRAHVLGPSGWGVVRFSQSAGGVGLRVSYPQYFEAVPALLPMNWAHGEPITVSHLHSTDPRTWRRPQSLPN